MVLGVSECASKWASEWVDCAVWLRGLRGMVGWTNDYFSANINVDINLNDNVNININISKLVNK